MNLKVVGLRLTLLVLITTVCLLAIEHTARWRFAESVTLFPRYHTSVKYGDFLIRCLRPNETFKHTSIDGKWEFSTNSQGYRNNFDFSYAKPNQTLRVIVLGDSHTEGFEVAQDETYAAQLGLLLTQQGIKGEVMNAGISGFSNAEELVYLENEGIRYSPDFVVLGFFANDLEDNLKASLYSLDNEGRLNIQQKTHIPGVSLLNSYYHIPFTRWLGENSYAYSILFNAIWDTAKHRLALSARKDGEEYARPTKDTFSSYEIRLCLAILKRISMVTHAAGAKIILVDIPTLDTKGHLMASMPQVIQSSIRNDVDASIDVAKLIKGTPFEFSSHVPHGQRHISKETHKLIAKELYNIINTDRKEATFPPSQKTDPYKGN